MIPTLHRLHFCYLHSYRLTLAGALATSLPQPGRGSRRPQALLCPRNVALILTHKEARCDWRSSLAGLFCIFPGFRHKASCSFFFFLTSHISLGAILQRYIQTNELAICNSTLTSRCLHHILSRYLTVVAYLVKGDAHWERGRRDQVVDSPP